MIRNTFQLVPGVGPWRGKDLWARGILTWDDFPASEPAIGISRRMDARVRLRIEESKVALRDRDLKRLAELIPPREHWRLYAEFQREAAFFDIETEGGSLLQPTVASVFDREGLHVFIRGRNLDQFPEVLATSRLAVTFNGSCFDIPALKAHFDSFPTPPAHLDLRFPCRRVGFSGGLQQILHRPRFCRPP